MVFLRLVLLWLFVFMLSVISGSAAVAAEPAGEIISTPIRGWQQFGQQGTTQTTAYLLVPEVLDDEGSLTLTFTGNAGITQIALTREELPERLHFLFGDYTDLHLDAPRPLDVFPGSVANFVVYVPYNKSSPGRLAQKYLILDAEGKVPQVKVTASYSAAYYNPSPKVELTPDHEGVYAVPRVQGLPDYRNVPGGTHSFASQSPQVQLNITHIPTQQRFEVRYSDRNSETPVPVLLPIVSDDSEGVSTNTIRASGKLLKPDGQPEPNAAISINSPQRWFPGMQDITDDTTITVLTTFPKPDGAFSLAVTPEFGDSFRRSNTISINVRENIEGLFAASGFSLPAGKQTDLKLPERLSLAACLVGSTGEPVQTADPEKPNTWTSLNMQKVDAEGKVQVSDHFSINAKETTGALFELKNLPVPGRFLLKQGEQVYGPVDIAETSPTEVIRFAAVSSEGRRVGLVKDEDGNPLAGALVLLSGQQVQNDDYKALEDLIGQIVNDDKPAGLQRLNDVTSKVVDYVITTGTGAYSFPRIVEGQDHQPTNITAVAGGRIGAHLYDYARPDDLLPNLDYELPEVRLPRFIKATGIVNAPNQIPDNENPGELKPYTGEQLYSVFHWSTRSWFDQTHEEVKWQYDLPTQSFYFGKPFEYTVPVGTTFTLGARPSIRDVHLSLQLWKEGPADLSDEPLELTSVTLRALQPFTLQANYANGKPAVGIGIRALYGTNGRVENGKLIQPVTDENGQYLLYGDEGLAPAITLTGDGYGRMKYEAFKIQPLDMSTSVPTLTLTLDPEIWGADGRKKQ